MLRSPRLILLLGLFFLSGACGLAYQVLWLRLLSLVFGVTVYAASTVLAAFMAGLALGSMLAAPVLARVKHPLRVFGIAELLVGASAVATPLGLDAAEGLYRGLHGLSADSFALLTIVRLVCAFVVLLVPTALMGLTLPVLSASRVVRESGFGSRVSALYAINTAGAVSGALVTGFVLIGAIGIRASFLTAAAVNAAVGVAALIWSGRESPDGARDAVAATEGPKRDWTIAAVMALSGVAALALEIVWFRMLVLYLEATTYAFTTMLATVLLGIALGGGIAAQLLRRDRDWTAWLAITLSVTGILVLGSSMALAASYGTRVATSRDAVISAAAILPAALMMGITFPIALRVGVSSAVTPQAAALGVGRLYALNVTGAIVGALMGGFVVLPQLGTLRALIATAAIYLVLGCIMAVRDRRRPLLLLATVVAAVLFAVVAARVPDPFTVALDRRHGRDMREFWRYDGVQNAVSVRASLFRRALYVDGLHQANDTPDMVRLHRIIGHLPMVLHPSPADVLVVGLGGGATSGAVSQYPGTTVQVVELSEGVRRAAPFFAHISYELLTQPHVRMRVDDGRNFLLLSGERFDVITADIIQPSHAGAGNLYSREYFSLVRQALKPGGVALQWIGRRSDTQYRLIMRTFLDVFPDATLWLNGELMVGTLSPLTIDRASFEAKRAQAVTAAALDDIGLRDFATLTSWYTAGANEMRQFVNGGLRLTDDRPLLEFHRSLPHNDQVVDLSSLHGDVTPLLKP